MAKGKSDKAAVVVVWQIEQAINDVRGHRVMLDSDRARSDGVQTHSLL